MTSCGHLTKSGSLCKNPKGKCRHHSSASQLSQLSTPPPVQGEGFLDVISYIPKRLYYMALGPRKTATKRFINFLETEGNQKVVDIQIARKPVESGVKFLMNALSLGRFNAKAKSLGYDDIYHAYTIITLENGRSYVVHKNEIVEQREATPADFKNERYTVPLPKDSTLTLKGMIERASTTDGGAPASKESQQRFWQYNGREDNCQDFVRQVIQDNDLQITDPKARELLVPQDGNALIDSLEEYSHYPKFITDVAATLDRGIHGDGLHIRF